MKVITTYLADDNMSFNSKEECENYEKHLFSKNNTLNNTLNKNLNNELKIINENFCLELDKDINEIFKDNKDELKILIRKKIYKNYYEIAFYFKDENLSKKEIFSWAEEFCLDNIVEDTNIEHIIVYLRNKYSIKATFLGSYSN